MRFSFLEVIDDIQKMVVIDKNINYQGRFLRHGVMLNRIFDQQLHGKRDNQAVAAIVGNIYVYGYLTHKPDVKQEDIGIEEVELGGEFHQLIILVFEHVAIHFREVFGKFFGQLRLKADKGGEHIQTVKQEMWIHLLFEYIELRLQVFLL